MLPLYPYRFPLLRFRFPPKSPLRPFPTFSPTSPYKTPYPPTNSTTTERAGNKKGPGYQPQGCAYIKHTELHFSSLCILYKMSEISPTVLHSYSYNLMSLINATFNRNEQANKILPQNLQFSSPCVLYIKSQKLSSTVFRSWSAYFFI